MRLIGWSLALGAVVTAISPGQFCMARERIRVEKARVRFVAKSWMIRGTWGLNEDKYLVEITRPGSGSPSLAQLVDRFQPEAAPLSLEVLTSSAGTVIRVRRGPECDIAFGKLTLRTAPGDLMATQPVRLSYRPVLRVTPRADEVIPCYRAIRR